MSLLLVVVVLLIDQAMRNLDPRVRIVIVHRFNSCFHSVFASQVAGCCFQYGSNSGVPFESCIHKFQSIDLAVESLRLSRFCNRSSCARISTDVTTSFPVCVRQLLYSLHKSETAPYILSWLTAMIVRKTVSIVCPSAQKCIDNFQPTLLLNVPRDIGLVTRKTGCPPFTKIINSATLSHSPPCLSL